MRAPAKHTRSVENKKQDQNIFARAQALLSREEEEEQLVDIMLNMSKEELDKHFDEQERREEEEERTRILEERIRIQEQDGDRLELAAKGRREAQKREAIAKSEIKKYLKNNLVVKKSLIADIDRYESLYVFSYGWAKLESPVYQSFMKSLAANNFSRVYIGRKRSLSRIIGLTQARELKPNLRNIGTMLYGDDVGLLLTNKTKEEVFSKFSEYKEFDFVKPGNTPMKTVMFKKYEVLRLSDSSARKLFPILESLKMPVKLINDRCIQLTEDYLVCKERERVTENASEILKHLNMQLFNYVLVPVCCWTASSQKTEYFDFPLPTRQ